MLGQHRRLGVDVLLHARRQVRHAEIALGLLAVAAAQVGLLQPAVLDRHDLHLMPGCLGGDFPPGLGPRPRQYHRRFAQRLRSLDFINQHRQAIHLDFIGQAGLLPIVRYTVQHQAFHRFPFIRRINAGAQEQAPANRHQHFQINPLLPCLLRRRRKAPCRVVKHGDGARTHDAGRAQLILGVLGQPDIASGCGCAFHRHIVCFGHAAGQAQVFLVVVGRLVCLDNAAGAFQAVEIQPHALRHQGRHLGRVDARQVDPEIAAEAGSAADQSRQVEIITVEYLADRIASTAGAGSAVVKRAELLGDAMVCHRHRRRPGIGDHGQAAQATRTEAAGGHAGLAFSDAESPFHEGLDEIAEADRAVDLHPLVGFAVERQVGQGIAGRIESHRSAWRFARIGRNIQGAVADGAECGAIEFIGKKPRRGAHPVGMVLQQRGAAFGLALARAARRQVDAAEHLGRQVGIGAIQRFVIGIAVRLVGRAFPYRKPRRFGIELLELAEAPHPLQAEQEQHQHAASQDRLEQGLAPLARSGHAWQGEGSGWDRHGVAAQ
ncbi:hypothetical protein CFU_2225 [Collimonas fungivorans Ter331]|uniref:Uncharacterized protein n=1 Tax=Collimonas fungivorans (strain Ter331) TaxID=1005048 RepID=G0AKC5_COLFT|nr:hypothetical protein CFU_2225 [Collimonas fungivorans Ter331]